MLDNKKIIAIIVISTLVLGALIPAANGITCELEKNSNINKKQFKNNIVPNFELEIKAKNILLKSNKPEKRDVNDDGEIDGLCSIYNLTYEISNLGPDDFEGELVTAINTPDDPIWIDAWHEIDDEGSKIITIKKDEKINCTHEVEVLTGDNSKIDLERKFANHEAILSTYMEGTNNNFNIERYWKNNSDYIPTLGQIIASTPWEYQKTTIQTKTDEIYYIQINNHSKLPNTITNRLGWIKTLFDQLTVLTEDIKTVLLTQDNSLINKVWDNIKQVITWIQNLTQRFKQLITEKTNYLTLIDLINQYKDNIIIQIRSLKNISSEYKTEINNLIEGANKCLKWMETEPWTKPILVEGQIEGIRKNEKIKMTCRNITKNYRDEDDGIEDGLVKYEFYINSTPMGLEKSYFDPHNCNLTIEHIGTDNKNIQTNNVLYYSFSNGSISTNFVWPPKIKITKPEYNNLYIQNKKIMLWFSTKIIGSLIIKVEDTKHNRDNIDYVDFYLNGELNHSDNQSPYEWELIPNKINRPNQPLNEIYELKTVAHDKNGYIITDELTVKIIPLAKAVTRTILIGTLLLLILSSLTEIE